VRGGETSSGILSMDSGCRRRHSRGGGLLGESRGASS
jgi:hypothetical protein